MIPFPVDLLQPRAWGFFARQFSAGKLEGTYVLHGPVSVGDWPLAIAVGALANCESQTRSNESSLPLPCGTCAPCRRFFALESELLHVAFPVPSHKSEDELNQHLLDGLARRRKDPARQPVVSETSSHPILRVRQIRDRLTRKAESSETRLVVFQQFERMLPASQDAMLKLIEEPPPRTVMILTTERLERLPATIISRARRVRLQRNPLDAALDYLTNAYEFSPASARTHFLLAGKSVGGALDLLARGTDEEAAARRATSLLLFHAIITEPLPGSIARLNDRQLIDTRARGDVEQMLTIWQSLVADATLAAQGAPPDELMNADFVPELTQCADRFRSPVRAAAVVTELKLTLADLRRNVHIPNALTALAIRLSRQ